MIMYWNKLPQGIQKIITEAITLKQDIKKKETWFSHLITIYDDDVSRLNDSVCWNDTLKWLLNTMVSKLMYIAIY